MCAPVCSFLQYGSLGSRSRAAVGLCGRVCVQSPAPLAHRLETAVGLVLLLPLRLVITILSLALCAALGAVATAGVPANRVGVFPLARWRRAILWPAPLCMRMFVAGLGFTFVRTRGQRASFEQAPVVVSNHIGLIEASFLLGAFRVCGGMVGCSIFSFSSCAATASQPPVTQTPASLLAPCSPHHQASAMSAKENFAIPLLGRCDGGVHQFPTGRAHCSRALAPAN